MLQLLMPDQVTPYWDEIRGGLTAALPPGPADREQRLLAKILEGLVQVWLSYRREDEKAVVDGVCLTSVVEDHIHDQRNLLLYALWAVGETHLSTWREGMDALKKYARGRYCSRVVGYTDQEKVIGLAKATGGVARYTFVTWET